MAELIFSRKDEVLFRSALTTRAFRVGRNPLNDLSLADPDVAPFEASFERAGEGTVVVDRSGRGVIVNDKRTERAELKHGDAVRFGALTATYQHSAGGTVQTGRLSDEGRNAELAWLELSDGRRFAVTETGLRVGKSDDDNDVVLPDAFVSTYHALVFRRGAATVVRDLGSTNGTFINSIRVTEAEAPIGSTLTFGRIAVQVVGREGSSEQSRQLAARSHEVKVVGELVYCDPAMDAVDAAIRSVAPHEASVCIMGESGTGKELVARAIHQLGPRASEPFVAVNCAALSPQLVESELFGHEKGAFTGADRARMGAFEEAGKGTLFLDEVGDLPPDAQAKLLRALENREVRRVGAEGSRKIHCRVVAATHQNLMQRVATGDFRNDLLHRLTVLPIRMPALRDRVADIPILADHFLKQLANGKASLTSAARTKLKSHSFPGNVRELRNVLLQAVVFTGKTEIDAADIAFPPMALADFVEEARIYQPGRTLAEIEAEAIEQAVQVHGSHSAAARELGIARSTVISRLASRRKRS